MAKHKEAPQTIELKNTKNGEAKILDITHATRLLINLAKAAKPKEDKTFTLPDGWIFNGVDIVKV